MEVRAEMLLAEVLARGVLTSSTHVDVCSCMLWIACLGAPWSCRTYMCELVQMLWRRVVAVKRSVGAWRDERMHVHRHVFGVVEPCTITLKLTISCEVAPSLLMIGFVLERTTHSLVAQRWMQKRPLVCLVSVSAMASKLT